MTFNVYWLFTVNEGLPNRMLNFCRWNYIYYLDGMKSSYEMVYNFRKIYV